MSSAEDFPAAEFDAILNPVGQPVTVEVEPEDTQNFATKALKNDDCYIVILNEGVDKKTVVDWLKPKLSAHHNITYDYHPRVCNGFAGKFKPEVLDDLRARLGNNGTIYVDEIVSPDMTVCQRNAPWGLQRISQPDRVEGNALALDFQFPFDTSGGYGVDIYVVDTGINIEHNDFNGRARNGWTAYGDNYEDVWGHGTHCAGTAAGRQMGVAKRSNLISVKVFHDDDALTSVIIAGIDYVIREAGHTGRPSVMSMSLSADPSFPLDFAVQAAMNRGIISVAAAGNQGADASTRSPARMLRVLTVANSTMLDKWNPSSNYGRCVDLFAPGTQVTSDWIGSPTATKVRTGTSMSTPHVSGVAATLLSRLGKRTHDEIKKVILDLGVWDKLSDVPADTPNLLLQYPHDPGFWIQE